MTAAAIKVDVITHVSFSRGQTVIRGEAGGEDVKLVVANDDYGLAVKIRRLLLENKDRIADQVLLIELAQGETGGDHELRYLRRFGLQVTLIAARREIGWDGFGGRVYQYDVEGVAYWPSVAPHD